jgi:hypothetical protein
MLEKFNPVEKVRLDNVRLEELYQSHGPTVAEDLISRAMEELAVLLAKVNRVYQKGDLANVRSVAMNISGISEQVGMSVLSNVACDVTGLTERNDGPALAATTARLTRLGERTLMAVWDIQDLSV